MDGYVNAIVSVIKADKLDPADCNAVIKSLSQCALSTKLTRYYMANAAKFRELKYTYDSEHAGENK